MTLFVLTTVSVLAIVSRIQLDLATGPRIALVCLVIPIILVIFTFILIVIGIPFWVWKLFALSVMPCITCH